MPLAVISDVHGNLPALEAVLADIKGRAVDFTVNLGDCVTSPLWPKETFEALQSLALPTVRGNHDRWIEEYPDDKLSSAGRFARNALTSEQRRRCTIYLLVSIWETGFWPAMARLMTIVRAFWRSHSTTDDSYPHVVKFYEARLGSATTARVVLCGHSHRQAVVHGPGECLILNPGSVGCPVFADILLQRT